MLICGAQNLREITLFPMNQRAEDLLMNAPAPASLEAIARIAHPRDRAQQELRQVHKNPPVSRGFVRIWQAPREPLGRRRAFAAKRAVICGLALGDRVTGKADGPSETVCSSGSGV
jgi:hypothetical protein